MPSAIGRKRERFTIESGTESADSEGQPVTTWATFATVWARAEFLSGRELEAMQKINSEISVRFTVHYRADVTEKMRVSWRSKYWNIHAIQATEDKFDMALMCSKVE